MKFGRVLDFTAGFGFYCRFWILLPILDFTADFGLKVRQVSAGFGCGEGYYAPKHLKIVFFLSKKLRSRGYPPLRTNSLSKKEIE